MSKVPRPTETLVQSVADVETRPAVTTRIRTLSAAGVFRRLASPPGESFRTEAVHGALTVDEARPAVDAQRPGGGSSSAPGPHRRWRRGRYGSLLADVAHVVAATEAQPRPAAAVVDAASVVEAGVVAADVPGQLASVAGGRAAAAAPEPGGRVSTDAVVQTGTLDARFEGAALAVHAAVTGGAEADGGAARLQTRSAVLAEVRSAKVNPLLTVLTDESNGTGTTDDA